MSGNNDDPLISDLVSASVEKWADATAIDRTKVDSTLESYHRYVFRKWIFIAACILIAVVVIGVSLTIGDYGIGFFETYEIIIKHLLGTITEEEELKEYIIITLRMPRIVIGLIAGAGLAVAGAVMQSILKNPLADPYTTGVSSGALFGATLAMTMGATLSTGQYPIVINAFVFSLIPMAVILVVSKLKNASPTVMIMAGIAVMYIFNAFTTVLKLWADPNDLATVYQWQVGSLSMAGWPAVPIMLVVTVAGVIMMQLASRKLNVLSTGDENAKAMGINVDRMRIICMSIVAMVSAVIVSFTGLIGFIGILAPHVVRLFIGADNRYLIPASAVFGSMLLILADLIGRTVIAPTVLQVGVITAFLGGPLFLWLIIRKKSVWG